MEVATTGTMKIQPTIHSTNESLNTEICQGGIQFYHNNVTVTVLHSL